MIWSVAEGKRGRRWREVRYRDVHVASSLLLETSPEGHFSHLELSTSSGLLTLHPEDDGSLHGNAVASEGVEHIRGLAWGANWLVMLKGSTICKVAAVDMLRRATPAWSSESRQGVTIPLTLWLEMAPIRVERISDAEWRIGGGEPIRLDDRGLPLLEDGVNWPLED